MSKNPFKMTPPPLDPKRNSFDLSYANNLTMKIGDLVPVMCKEVIPGDTFTIDPKFAIRFMPMQFPVQTRMRADLHFFYVRTRNLWKNWKKFIGDTHEHVHPYISQTDPSFFNNGSLADYLGVPTATVSSQAFTPQYPINDYVPSSGYDNYNPAGNGLGLTPTVQGLMLTGQVMKYLKPIASYQPLGTPVNFGFGEAQGSTSMMIIANSRLSAPIAVLQPDAFYFKIPDALYSALVNMNCTVRPWLLAYRDGAYHSVGIFSGDVPKVSELSLDALRGHTFTVQKAKVLTSSGTLSVDDFFAKYSPEKLTLAFVFTSPTKNAIRNFILNPYPTINLDAQDGKFLGADLSSIFLGAYQSGYNVTFSAEKAYAPDKLPISALPFRAYESIYNGFYRNEQIDPLVINGQAEYDVFCPNMEDGADTYPYALHKRYWEKDFLTTAVPSPQQGPAPLVGVNRFETNTQLQKMTVKPASGADQEFNIYTDKDGKVIGLNHYPVDIPTGSLDALQSAIDFGISISDFRNVNALQRWLEINQRRGYRYKDQIMSHFGVNVTFEELDMPEYIGGVSQDVSSSAVISQTDNGEGKLGSFAGMCSCFGSSDNKVRKYCDEHGFIIGIISISPIPVYTQLLPKMFLKSKHLDYFFPEFGHIGLQPITYKEVTPLQVIAANGDLNKTFGYQRAWYEYLASTDEAHGDFRTKLRNFLLNREFASAPQLNAQFLDIDETEVNDIFSYTGDTDKVLGQIYFNIHAERPIPFFGTPRLE